MHAIHFDPPAVRAAYEAAVASLLDLCAPLQPGDWGKPGLESWNVRELIGHASRALTTVRDYLEAGAHRPLELQSALDYLPAITRRFADVDSAALAARARAAAESLGPDPLASLRALAQEVLALVRATPDDAPLATLVGTMRLIDYLPTRIFELVVHCADLALATGQRYRPDPEASLIAWTMGAAAAALAPEPMAGLLALTGRGPLPQGFSVVP